MRFRQPVTSICYLLFCSTTFVLFTKVSSKSSLYFRSRFTAGFFHFLDGFVRAFGYRREGIPVIIKSCPSRIGPLYNRLGDSIGNPGNFIAARIFSLSIETYARR